MNVAGKTGTAELRNTTDPNNPNAELSSEHRRVVRRLRPGRAAADRGRGAVPRAGRRRRDRSAGRARCARGGASGALTPVISVSYTAPITLCASVPCVHVASAWPNALNVSDRSAAKFVLETTFGRIEPPRSGAARGTEHVAVLDPRDERADRWGRPRRPEPARRQRRRAAAARPNAPRALRNATRKTHVPASVHPFHASS